MAGLPAFRVAEVIEELLDMADAGIHNLSARDLLQGSLGDAGSVRDLLPASASGLKPLHHVIVHVYSHSADGRPIFGFTQPTFGSDAGLACNYMKGQKKITKTPGFMRVIVAENIQKLMDVKFKESRNRPKALALATGNPKEGGISLSTVQRILARSTGATVDNLEAIADALDVSLYQLLIPSLDVENPQIVHGAVENEERMYKRWKRSPESSRMYMPLIINKGDEA